MPKYLAEIETLLDVAKDRMWIWSGESPRYKNGAPVFQAGDQLSLRLRGRTGPHTIVLKPKKAIGAEQHSPPLPFAPPHDKPEFEFNSDDQLVVVIKLLSQASKWDFSIRHGQGDPVDPEFQVGTGSD